MSKLTNCPPPKIEIFEPAMCCPTGLCGTSIDSELLRVSTIVNSLASKGMIIARYNLTNDPKSFASNEIISKLLATGGVEVLPVTLVDGEIMKKRSYPTNDEFSKWLNSSYKEASNKKDESKCCGGSKCC